MNKSKWFAYTVLVALIPMAARLVVWLSLKGHAVPPFAPPDIVAFGLVLNISVINEIEHLQRNDAWKTLQNGVAITFIALFSVLYAVLLVAERNAALVDETAVLWCVTGLAGVSLIVSLSVLHRLSAVQQTR